MQCRFSEYEMRFTDNGSSPARTKNRDFGLRQTQNELARTKKGEFGPGQNKWTKIFAQLIEKPDLYSHICNGLWPW